MHHHDNKNYFVIGNTYGTFKTVFAGQVDKYALTGEVMGNHSVVVGGYLNGIYRIALMVTKGGNFIFTAYTAGDDQGNKSLATSLYNFFKCVNPYVNVLLNYNSTIFSTVGDKSKLYFGVPLSAKGGTGIWALANRNCTVRQYGYGDVIFNKTGKPVTFTFQLQTLVNQ